ncbi:MAG TPA: tagaturonate reductase [Hanamia sp.]
MNLSRYTLNKISSEEVSVPDVDIFELPEKVLQFGTGVLLRGLPDFFIDKANSMGIFNGRVVVVKSTSKGDTAAFEKQDGLYTLCERGVVDAKKIESNRINSSISRVLTAQTQWKQVLALAKNKDIQIIISNTTEAGIKLVNEDVNGYPPVSFPGKLLAFLYERFKVFKGDEKRGFVIIPTELILENGKKLETIVLELAHLNSLEPEFIEWIEKCNFFCNSLVDRIVTGMPDEKIRTEIENELGYKDDLLTVSEVYRLWAIEGDSKISKICSFADADEGVVIEPNIELQRELKLRLLNGTHTLTCGLAFLAGIDTVQHAMENKFSETFIENLMRNELSPSIPYDIQQDVKDQFISKTLDRFRNPHINHQWKSITFNYTAKMKMRCIPLLVNYYKKNENAPPLFSLGFAAYIYFMKALTQDGKAFYGQFNGVSYLIEDEMAEKFFLFWKNNSTDELVNNILQSISLWDYDLSTLPGFSKAVTKDLIGIMEKGVMKILKN